MRFHHEHFRKLRQSIGFSQKRMADVLGVGLMKINFIENGRQLNPGFDFIEAAAAYLKVHPAELMIYKYPPVNQIQIKSE